LAIWIYDFFYTFAARKEKCGEIWLLATTLKNAKMLTRSDWVPVSFISMFCIFVTAPHQVGLFCCPTPQLILEYDPKQG
jgi:hypothetical protein